VYSSRLASIGRHSTFFYLITEFDLSINDFS
jgi:hypothetical protein